MNNRRTDNLSPLITFYNRYCLFTLLLVFTSATGACGQGTSSDAEWLKEVLELQQGDIAAEMGAGDGNLTLNIARHVGPEGQVYSSELGADSVEYLQKVVNSNSVSNITVISGKSNQTNFPKECCNALFMRRVYHHFGDPASMNKSIWQSLKPGGKVAIIDFTPRGSESAEADGRDTSGQHGVTSETVVEELKEAGFTLVSSEVRSERDVYVVMQKKE